MREINKARKMVEALWGRRSITYMQTRSTPANKAGKKTTDINKLETVAIKPNSRICMVNL